MSTTITTYDKRAVIVSPTAPTSLKYLDYLWLDVSEGSPVLRYYNASTETWTAINDVDVSRFLTTDGVQTITGAKTFNTGTITVADITVGDVTIEGIDTIKLTDDDTHVPTSKLVEDTLVSAISGLETAIEGELATKANTADVVLKTDISTSIPSAGAVDTKVASEKAVADSLATKQNTLNYYSETSEGIYSATISVGNINLRGSVAEGSNTTTSNNQCHAEGYGTTASGDSSHAEGRQTTASGQGSHAEGVITEASGDYSHTEGGGTYASGGYSHAEGYYTIASSDYQHTQGKYNIKDANDKYADIIGNGSADNSRSNAQTVSWDGISWSQTDVRAGGTDQDAATHSLAAKQNATDNTLTTTDKTIVGAINELSSDKQNTLQTYAENVNLEGSSTINVGVSGGYDTTLNLNGGGSYANVINIGSESSNRVINIAANGSVSGNDAVNIGNTSTGGVSLTLNTGRGLAGTGVTKDLSTSATDAQFPTAAAVNNQLILKQNITDNTLTTTAKTISGAINEIENKVLDSRLSKLSAGSLYFNSGKLSGANFAIPTFPFSICATVRIDAWKSASENHQTIFQCGDYGSTTDPWVSLAFSDLTTSAKLRLIMLLVINGAPKTTEVNCALDLSTFLGKMHTIIGICRAVTAEALNWDIYIDGVKQNITSSLKNVVVSSLSGTRNWAVNTTNYNFSSQPAPANPMMLRNLYIFNFDISAEGSPYSIADYEAGRLIPPALKPSQVSLALENYTIARNATTTLVKDASGNSNDATVKVSSGGYVAGDNDQSIKVFVDEIKTQINQSNG